MTTPHWILSVFLVFLVGCATTPRLANTLGAEGHRPEHYEQTIREHLRVTLLDPYSVQDFRVTAQERTWCVIPSEGTLYQTDRARGAGATGR